MLTIRVSYCHREQRWRVHECVEHQNGDVRLPAMVKDRDFGPFEDTYDVRNWINMELMSALPLMKKSPLEQEA